jgi:transglutaminase-like putative cysteine protease
MLFRIEHETRLTYSEPVTEAVIEARMAPESSEDQTVLGYRLRVSPITPVTTYRDGFGNRVDLFNVLSPHREIVLSATSYVQPHRRPAEERLAGLTAADAREPSLEALEFLERSRLVGRSTEVDALAAALDAGPLAEVLVAAMQAVRGRLKYEKRVTTARTPLDEVLRLGCGVCQDFAHLMIGICRTAGLPARYVSGYVQEPGEIETHAWCQLWCGPAGWIDLDPTHACFVGPAHVVTAVGRDYSDVPPNRGVWKGTATETMSVAVSVATVERMPPDETDVGFGRFAAVPAGVRSAPTGEAAYRAQVKALYRHQQEQQQQGRRTFFLDTLRGC